MHFAIEFYWNFPRFGLRKWTLNSMVFASLSKKLILQKSLFFLKEIAIFLVLSLPKSTKFRCKNPFENDIEKKGSKIDFEHRFWLSKTTKIAPKSDAKRDLFCDVMDLSWESSEINGTHSFWTTNLATHMNRSSWSAPRRPNHQSKFFNLKRFTHVSSNAMRAGLKKKVLEARKSFKIELRGAENPSKKQL